ncbi:MAG: acid phosphatase [Enterobacteriaceae bacterium]
MSSASYSETKGFLQATDLPDMLKLLPPPPAPDSIAFLQDKAMAEYYRSSHSEARWRQAQVDADLSADNFGKLFSGALGVTLSPKTTPETIRLLERVEADSGSSATEPMKKYYQRIRPFKFYNQTSCDPEQQKELAGNGSYPSGHTSFAWAAALILAELEPARQQQILQRGWEMGDSRMVCGMHWKSDVDMGRIVASVTVARLHANSDFQLQLGKAKAELAKLSKSGD